MHKTREELRNKALKNVLQSFPQKLIDIDINTQTLSYLNSPDNPLTFPVSTSRFGTGNKEGSNKTPPGVHVISEKIGAGFPEGTIFKDRKSTGTLWNPEIAGENLILSRILRLRGLQPGINAGAGIDSHDRYIYIHGTNQEQQIGTPISHGCVCMKNSDIITLFDLVQEKTIVYIG